METKQIPKYTIQDVVMTPNEIDAVIVGIEYKNAREVYGVDKIKKKELEVYNLLIEAEQYKIRIEEPFSIFPLNEVPENSKLGKFIKKYEKFEAGMQIVLEKNENKFWQVKLG